MNTLSTYLLDPPIDGIREVQLALTSPIGAGANARVYKEKIGNNHYAIKIYSDPNKCNVPKLRAMLQNPPDIYGEYSSINYPLFGWALSLLIDKKSQSIIGFVMPLIDDQKSKTLDYFYDSILSKKLASTSSKALSFKIEILLNLCRAIDDLHNRGHKFVDLKPQNLRVFEGTNIVSLIDCDGYTILDKTTGNEFRADMVSTDYIAPEINKLDLKKDAIPKSQDDYALAVIIFQMLNRGIHPFQGIIKAPNIFVSTNDEKALLGLYPYGQIKNDKTTPLPISIHDMLLDETRVLFDRAFTTQNRPSAKEWAEHFQDIIFNKRIVRCKKESNNIEHMRFRDKECPACSRAIGVSNPRPVVPKPGLPPAPVKQPGGSNIGKDIFTIFIVMLLVAIPVTLIVQSTKPKLQNQPIQQPTETPTAQVQIPTKQPDPISDPVRISVCNQTDKDAYVSINFAEGNLKMISGWFKIPPKRECTELGPFKRQNLYWYASAIDREWAGKDVNYAWCIDMQKKFDLTPKTNCLKSESRKIFNKVETNNPIYYIWLEKK